MPQPVLELDHVSKRFGPVTAADDLSLVVEQGEFFALLGPSGSGKTTLLRIIAGLELPDRGRVLINGQDVTRLPPYARRVGMVFQNFLLFPHRTVAENVVFPLRMQGVDKAAQQDRLDWALRLLRLEGLAGRYPSQLSGGQQQRVALARGLIARPALLLLDEPLANLDRELRKEMEVEVRRYQVELETPFVYVTHNQEEALTMSDRIAVMHHGRFEQVAPKLEVYTHPASPFVAGFVGHANRMRGPIRGLQGGLARLDWDGVELLVPCPAGAGPGAVVEYFITCEHLSLIGPDEPWPGERQNRVAAVWRDVIFKGATADDFATLANGAELIVTDAVALPRIRRHEPIHVVWPPEAGHAFVPREG